MDNSSPKEKTTLVEHAYLEIIDRIENGKISLDDFISHRQLADELNISKQPIGIALQRLEYEGVVESAPRVGTRIRPVTIEDMWGMLQWRIGLEMRTIALACDYAGSADISLLSPLAEELDRVIALPATELAMLRKADMQFHLALANASQCRWLRQELAKLKLYYLKNSLCEAVHITREQLPAKPAVTHRQLVNAIKMHERAEAALLIEKHIEQSTDMRRFVEWYKQKRSY